MGEQIMGVIYGLGCIVTFIVLCIFDSNTGANGAEWLIVIPINIFLSTIWPVYWGIVHWVMY